MIVEIKVLINIYILKIQINKITWGGFGGLNGGFGTFGSVIFQFRIGFLIGPQSRTIEQSSWLFKGEFTIISITAFL